MNPEEREQLKAELREELMNELSSKSRKTSPGLDTVYKKWFYGPDRRNNHKDSKMAKAFGNANQWGVWEAIRTLVRLIFGRRYVAQLISDDQQKVEEVANTICELIYSLKAGEKEEV